MTHENLVKGLLTDGLDGASFAFQRDLDAVFNSLEVTEDWTLVPDLTQFLEDRIGTPLITALYGPGILHGNQSFVRDIWAYDKSIMSLARRVPRIFNPTAYQLRDRVLSVVKEWHVRYFQTENSDSSHNLAEEKFQGGLPFMKERYNMLMGAAGQDADSVASTDMAFIWASITNVVPSSEALLIEVLKDQQLATRVREACIESLSGPHSREQRLRNLEKSPLLLSLYAETLRLIVQIHIPRTPSHHRFHSGGQHISTDKLVITNTRSAHMNAEAWNTRGGQHPIDKFWAERFLLHPLDPSSGPIRRRETNEPREGESQEVRFSVEGTEGMWIPFGGGQHACPGRHLARRIMLITLAELMTGFDIELLASDAALQLISPRFGFGVQKPAGPVPFRIKRRLVQTPVVSTQNCSPLMPSRSQE